ncbi:HNH endonuclease [Niabella sp. CC-SYL272]|uniref:HNH endonuclease n=1 Tax=Niabella agricola TaxID=2891571 RepID=UPI001F26191B|nr:HNH endonuclease signature motif containing protein [Niabella agricola]MCF3107294.1 HNH endonuclease [Niabella agricola]
MKKGDRKKVFEKYGGRCAYCGCELGDKWQVDHAISKCYWFYVNSSDPEGVNHIDNLKPACVPCNHYKRSQCVDDINGGHNGFRSYMLSFHKRLARLPKKTGLERTRRRIAYMNVIAEKYGITPEKPFNGVFYFETIKKGGGE